MKQDLIRIFGIIIIILFISYFIYPTINYYPNFDDDTIVKVNRLTGNTYLLDPELHKWRKLNQN